MKKINVLWTGGWDSTFRIVELSYEKVEIQPYYVLDEGRFSQKKEIEVMKKIESELKQRKETKARLLPIKFINKGDINKNDEITETYKKCHTIYHIGSQYDWLARLALEIDGKLEIGVEKAETSKALAFIEKCGSLRKEKINGSYTYLIDKDKSNADLNLLFGKFNFPIIDKTKLDMKRIAEEKGFDYIMNMTWFCHSPINNKPCGFCNPCVSTLEEGFEYRFSDKALKRYKYRKFYRLITKVPNKLRKICNHIYIYIQRK